MPALALVVFGLALAAAWVAWRIDTAPRSDGEVMDMRQPGEAFCARCPDHEGCMSGYPCSLVRRVNGVES